MHVFVIGAKGLGGYGGYETFIRRLLEYMPEAVEGEEPVVWHIACKAGGYGASDESELPGAEPDGAHDFRYRGALCHKIGVPGIGPAQAVLYDLKASLWALRLCRRESIRRPAFYILTCRIGPAAGYLARRVHALGGLLYLNPDGHEWMRRKWNRAVRAYWKYSEARMVRAADRVICDSRRIEDYIRETYGLPAGRTVYLSYGAETGIPEDPQADRAFEEWLAARGLEKGAYYLAVGRFVPENSYDVIFREYAASGTDAGLLVISTRDEKYLRKLRSGSGTPDRPGIVLAGPVYDDALLRRIRAHARAYIHGHTVGGTNPSLLESMAAARPCLVRDAEFNLETAGDAALAWSGEAGSLAELIRRVDRMSEDQRNALGLKAEQRILQAYQWPAVAQAYRKLFAGDKGTDD